MRAVPSLPWAGVVARRDRAGVKEGPGMSPGLMADDGGDDADPSAGVSPAGLGEGGDSPGVSVFSAAVAVEEACCSSARFQNVVESSGGGRREKAAAAAAKPFHEYSFYVLRLLLHVSHTTLTVAWVKC